MPVRKRSLTPAADSVAALERATGIPRATLRVWERRYGFPQPTRDDRGNRVYDASQLDKLQLVAQLMARGQRPGQLVAQPVRTLQALLAEAAAQDRDEPLVDLLRGLDTAAVLQHLLQQLATQGLARFVAETLASCFGTVGHAWARGALQPLEEHLFSECVQQVLRTAIAALAPAASRSHPRVLLVTLPGEQHGLGLLMVHAILAQHRCPCLPLGTSLAETQIALAAERWAADVVAISASDARPVREVSEGLRMLRELLPAEIEIWVGGSSRALARPAVTGLPGLQVFADVAALEPAIAARRAAPPR